MATLTKNFVTAGKAVFTVSSPKGGRYTFKVSRKDANGSYPEAYFLSLLTGSDNENDYTYVGMVNPSDGSIRLTRASNYNGNTVPVKVARWLFSMLWGTKDLPAGYLLHHEGRCGRCGRTLTVPESID